VADQLRHLYDHPDYVELYPGLVTEPAKKPTVPGSGLCPSYTVSRAVLSDAVALVRGDRFYTIDYHPKKLTNWGFAEAASDVSIDNGCVAYKLFLHAFPNHFKPNSIYAHYPLTIPPEMEKVMRTLERNKNYDFKRPARMGATKVVSSLSAAKAVLANTDAFKTTSEDAVRFLLGDSARTFMAANEGEDGAKMRQLMQDAIYLDGKWEPEVRRFYETMTTKLLKDKAYKIAKKNQVDMVRDIGNLAHVHFAAEMWALPLKTAERPLGVFTDHELFLIMQGVFSCVYFDSNPVTSFPLLQKTKQATELLGELVYANVSEIHNGGIFSRLTSAIWPQPTPLKDYGVALIKRLLATGIDVKQLVYGHVLGTMGAMTANQAQLFAQILEFYLTAGREHLEAMRTLAGDDSDAAFEKLMHYVLEGARLAGEPGVYRLATKAVSVTVGNDTLSFAPGDRALVNLLAASRDPTVFPNPDVVDPTRKLESYLLLGQGSPYALGDGIMRVALTAMFKIVCRLPGLRAAPGPQGVLHKVEVPWPEQGTKREEPWFHAYLSEGHDGLWPFPQSKYFCWFFGCE
jgi:linoleate 8R-lipoxygenase/9,12-octadecadienoate 8-hydroperoxide 8R-isomerase